jgi:hypothetical protein
MGLAGPTPYTLKLTRGKLDRIAYVGYVTAQDHGVAGDLTPYPKMPIPLTLHVRGVNWNWPAGVWQPGLENPLSQCGVFEGAAWARLDATQDGPFYAGNLVTADESRLRIGLLDWTGDKIALELNNPTDQAIDATVRTPSEIVERYRLEEKVALEPGESKRVTFAKQ